MRKLWMSWSTGKDSAYALLELKKQKAFEVTGLVTTVTEDYQRVAMHSTRETLLQKQAEALSLPLEIVRIPNKCSNEIYEQRMRLLIEKAISAGVTAMGFGDLFLSDVRVYRERLLAGSGIDPIFPLWNQPTNVLAKNMMEAGIRAILTCVDPSKLDRSFAGKQFDEQTISHFPSPVDPCGENGEFHTFVYSSPNFSRQIPIQVGEVVERDGFIFTDVIPT